MNNDRAGLGFKKAYETISAANAEAYNDLFLISNQVLCKKPSNNNFLDDILSGKSPKRLSGYAIICRLLVYYVKSFAHIALYLFKFIEFRLSAFSSAHSPKDRELILIDIFFPIDKINRAMHFNDQFFPGLTDVLKKYGKNYTYLPFFHSASYNKKPFELYRALRIMKKEKVPAITEYQLLTAGDIGYLLYFTIAYPLRVLRFARKLDRLSSETRLLGRELAGTVDQVAFYAFSRYLQGRRIAKLPYSKIKVISWYENQPMHKNLYKGLREGSSKVEVYGAQLFLYPKDYLAIIPDKNEKRFGVIPDHIVVNGPAYIPENTKLPYSLGPSLRYAKVFSTTIKKEERDSIVVILPYFPENAQHVLDMLKDASLISEKILIKPHPGLTAEKFKNRIPPGANMVSSDTYELFKTAKMVIGSLSGALMEAAALGIPVISINDGTSLGNANPLPEYGKGIIWEEARNAEDLASKVRLFNHNFDKDPERIRTIVGKYKQLFFCEVSEARIAEAFGIQGTA